MSKGKEFRGQRKRGFDDDGPMPSFDMPPAFGSRPPSRPSFGGGNDSAPSGPPVDATVKWFKGDKGFGFVELGNGQGDAFLHIGALQSSGHEGVPPGAKLSVQVGQGAKGLQVTKVLSVDLSTATAERPQRAFGDRPAFGDRGGNDRGGDRGGFGGGSRPQRQSPDPSSAVEVQGTVKWFDETKGFGFVANNAGGKDVFVHISVLGAAGLRSLAEGQAVTMKVVDTAKGREALSISA